MEFITGKCPKCQGELQIPEGHAKIICMYCAEEIDTNQAIQEAEYTPSKEEQEKYAEYEKRAQELFPKMLFSIEDPLKDFKKKTYEGSFRAYEAAQEEILEVIELAYRTSPEKSKLLETIVAELIGQVEDALSQKKKRQQEEAMLGFNMSLVIYLDPALLDCNKLSGKPMVDELLRQWKEHFPKTNLKPSDFETINNGFKRRFCYITTAVCEHLGKADDCYELNLLREYRDGYLQQQEDGEALINRYYDMAPTIVKRINKSEQTDVIYAEIWKDYLSPCISLIEHNNNEACKEVYQNMVNTLAKKYFN